MNNVITIKAFRRPFYLSRLLASMEKCGIGDRKIFLSIDKHGKDTDLMFKVYKQSSLKNQIILDIHDKYGCAGNMKHCFEWAFKDNKYDEMIHLEEDVIIAGDYFKWMNWALDYMNKNNNIFAVCPAIRKCNGGSTGELTDNIISKNFECCGGFGINRREWDYIESLGGIFGVIGRISNWPPEKWKNVMKINKDGSWAWPFRCYFLRDKKCLSPCISRANNIGEENGRFNISKDWHNKMIFDDNWIGSEIYNNVDLSNLTYKVKA